MKIPTLNNLYLKRNKSRSLFTYKSHVNQKNKLVAQQYRYQYQTILSDVKNIEKKYIAKVDCATLDAHKQILGNLLTIIDDLEYANESIINKKPVTDTTVQGFRLILKKLTNVLSQYGLKRLQSLHSDFNIKYHEAIRTEYNINHKDNVVLQEYQKGYTLKNIVLRPAKVSVNKIKNKG